MKTRIRPDSEPPARRVPSERNVAEYERSDKETVCARGESLSGLLAGLKREREAEWVAARRWGSEGEKSREVMEETSGGRGWGLKDFQ